MPLPVSRISAMSIWRPELQRRANRTVSRPPSGMDSRAFMKTLRKSCFSWATSPEIHGCSASYERSAVTRACSKRPDRRVNISSIGARRVLSKLWVRHTLRQQFGKRLNSDERVFDFVGDPRGEGGRRRESFDSPLLTLHEGHLTVE